MIPRLRQIVLDFDGVIADGTNRAYIDSYTRAVRAVGSSLPEAQIEAAVLSRWGESPRRELGAVLGDGHARLGEALDHYLGVIDTALLERARPLPGALEAVARLASRYRLYLISGMGEAPLKQILEAFGLKESFVDVVSTCDSDLPERQKASGYHLRRLCQRDGLTPQDTLCVGDARSDLAMAHSCAIPVALVLTGALDREAAEALGADWIVDSLAGLSRMLADEKGAEP